MSRDGRSASSGRGRHRPGRRPPGPRWLEVPRPVRLAV